MKLVSVIANPWLLITSFLFILVSGEHIGGFYALYILMALPHGGLHAVLALTGIGLLLFGDSMKKAANKLWIHTLLNFLGVACLYFSLIIFFERSRGYNNSSFEQVMPVLSMILFICLSIVFLVRLLYRRRMNIVQ